MSTDSSLLHSGLVGQHFAFYTWFQDEWVPAKSKTLVLVPIDKVIFVTQVVAKLLIVKVLDSNGWVGALVGVIVDLHELCGND